MKRAKKFPHYFIAPVKHRKASRVCRVLGIEGRCKRCELCRVRIGPSASHDITFVSLHDDKVGALFEQILRSLLDLYTVLFLDLFPESQDFSELIVALQMHCLHLLHMAGSATLFEIHFEEMNDDGAIFATIEAKNDIRELETSESFIKYDIRLTDSVSKFLRDL